MVEGKAAGTPPAVPAGALDMRRSYLFFVFPAGRPMKPEWFFGHHHGRTHGSDSIRLVGAGSASGVLRRFGTGRRSPASGPHSGHPAAHVGHARFGHSDSGGH